MLLLLIFEASFKVDLHTILRDFSDAQRSGSLVSKIYELFFKDIGMCCQRYMSFFPKIYELYTKDGLTIFNSILFFLRQSIKKSVSPVFTTEDRGITFVRQFSLIYIMYAREKGFARGCK